MLDALINGWAGAGRGIIAEFITYPLQTVYTRRQTELDSKKDRRNLGTLAQMRQGVYYYFYQILRNKAETAALEQKRKGIGDGSVWDALLTFCCCFIWTHRKEPNRTLPGQGLSIVTEQPVLSTIESPPL